MLKQVFGNCYTSFEQKMVYRSTVFSTGKLNATTKVFATNMLQKQCFCNRRSISFSNNSLIIIQFFGQPKS